METKWKPSALMNLVVGAAIFAVHIHAYARRHQSVIKRGIERSLHGGRCLKLNLLKLAAPQLLRPGTDRIEVESGHFRIHVGDRILLHSPARAQPSQ